MNPFEIFPLPAAVAARIRQVRADDFGNRDLAPDAGDAGRPCRACLEDSRAGEAMLLFSYSPFSQPRPYRSVGPIFIHAHACAPPRDRSVVPDQLRRRLLALRSYDREDRMLEADIVAGTELEPALERLLADPAASVVHVHNARPGCFACAIRRAGES
ncbi:MAG TPA: DUF1203 domain-containing protein [Kofleriaceae bacterium]